VQTFVESVEDFLEVARDWLSEEDHPARAALRHMAVELDNKMSPALLSQFGLSYRSLLARKPSEDGGELDALDNIIPADNGTHPPPMF
jgi:hypothetical protein